MNYKKMVERWCDDLGLLIKDESELWKRVCLGQKWWIDELGWVPKVVPGRLLAKGRERESEEKGQVSADVY